MGRVIICFLWLWTHCTHTHTHLHTQTYIYIYMIYVCVCAIDRLINWSGIFSFHLVKSSQPFVRGNQQCLYDHFNKDKKNIERHTADTIVSWPYPKQWVIVHTSDLMMVIRQSINILSIITRDMGKLKTYSPTYCIMDNGENMLNLTHTLDKIYLTGIL